MYWVIGGTSGIGRATATRLAEKTGLNVLATDREESDVTSYESMKAAVAQIVDSLLKFDNKLKGIVYSAGVNELEWLGEMGHSGVKDGKDVIDTNLTGFIRLMDILYDTEIVPRHLLRGLSVVAVSSDAARRPMRTSAMYCASKAGLDMAVRVAAREGAKYGVRVLAVSPGMTEGTNITDYIDSEVPRIRDWTPEEALKYERQQEVVQGRVLRQEVAQVIHTALQGPPHWTGDIITINGGR